jgi:D-lyxose ketol-isomerase
MTTPLPPAPTIPPPDIARDVFRQGLELIRKVDFPLTQADRAELKVNDFGLGDLRNEGFVFADLLRTDRVRMTLLVLLPYQTLPEHLHPPYDNEPGKEETLRCLWGETRIYVPGEPNNPSIRIPQGKEACYTSRHEIVLHPGEQFSVQPNLAHWFQGGPEGAVNLAFQNRVNEDHNIFTDPRSTGCPIPMTNY